MSIEKLKEAYRISTPGQWKAYNNTVDIQHNLLSNIHIVDCNHKIQNKEANAEFIAQSHNMMPDLLEAVDALEAMVMIFGPKDYSVCGYASKVLAKLKGV
jgi:hypothetical protein